MRYRVRLFALALLLTTLLRAETESDSCSGKDPSGRACTILRTGVKAKDGRTRTKAVRSLATLSADPRARRWAEEALSDKDVDVRCAAAGTLAQIGGDSSAPFLIAALNDPEPRVV